MNFRSRNACRRCGTARANTPVNNQQLKPGDWTCQSCNANNFASRPVCFKCQRSKPQSNLATETVKAGDWVCSQCSTNNFASRNACFKCNRAKDAAQSTSASNPVTPANNPMTPKPGDWKCASCSEMNFGSRTVCRRCGTARPNEGTSSSSSSTECVICMDKPIDSVITTCGHSAVCLECGNGINKCPICRNSFTREQIIKLYLVH